MNFGLIAFILVVLEAVATILILAPFVEGQIKNSKRIDKLEQESRDLRGHMKRWIQNSRDFGFICPWETGYVESSEGMKTWWGSMPDSEKKAIEEFGLSLEEEAFAKEADAEIKKVLARRGRVEA